MASGLETRTIPEYPLKIIDLRNLSVDPNALGMGDPWLFMGLLWSIPETTLDADFEMCFVIHSMSKRNN